MACRGEGSACIQAVALRLERTEMSWRGHGKGQSQTTAVTCGRRVVVVVFEEAGVAVGRVVACKWVSTSRGDMYVSMCVCMYVQ